MGFHVDPDAYDRFMGRFSAPLADEVVPTLGVGTADAVLDVGCGPGALTSRLVGRAGRVAAVDPAEPFVAAVRTRLPGVDVRRASAQDLPFDDGAFDVTVAQLVVHFLPDPVAGLREMRRVTRTGGTVAVSVWDHAARGPLAAFWRAVRDLDPASPGEDLLPGVRRGHLAQLCRDAGLRVDDDSEATVSLRFEAVDDWWEPFTLGVGPAGDHVAGLDAAGRARLRDRCAQVLGAPPFTVDATAWVVRAHV